jgi:predicted choloylglycine hydrolase
MKMSTNYVMELQRSLDLLVYTQRKKALRSDDYEVLSQFGNEENAKEALKDFFERHKTVRRNGKDIHTCDLTEDNGHIVVSIGNIFNDIGERIAREKFVKSRQRRYLR